MKAIHEDHVHTSYYPLLVPSIFLLTPFFSIGLPLNFMSVFGTDLEAATVMVC